MFAASYIVRRVQLGEYLVEVDAEATVAAYAGIPTPGPEDCGCWYCQNWVAGREQLVPPAVRELLASLGIPLAGEVEVWEVPGDAGPHIYGGWYMLVGRIVQGPVSSASVSRAGWDLTFSHGASYPVPAFAGQQVCELHFLCNVGNFIPEPQ